MSDIFDLRDLEKRMDGAVSVARSEFSSLRTGRASVNMLDPILVDAYGASMPINQLATVSVPEPRMLSVQVWDAGLAEAVDKAIRDSEMDLNPIMEGAVLRIPVPDLNEERRRDMVKVAHKYAENARVAVRHVRRDGMETLKRAEKDGQMGEDEQRKYSDDVQSLTDSHIKQIDELLAAKEAEIMQV